MANKYTTRLTADTSQHDKSIKKSATEIYKYKKNIDDAKKTLGTLASKFGALGAAIGVGVGTLTTFGTALKGIESVADSTARTQDTLTYSIKQFFLSLSSGSFDGFLNGLRSIINKAKEAYDAIDSLRTFQSFNSLDLAQNKTKQDQLNLNIKKIKTGLIKDPNGVLLKQYQKELNQLQNERLNLVNQEITHYNRAIKAQENKIQALLTTPHAKELYQKFTKNGASYDEVVNSYNAAERAWIAIQAERTEAATMGDGQNLSVGADREWYKKNKERYDRIREEYQVMLQIKNLEQDIVAKKQLEIEKEITKQNLIATETGSIRQLKTTETATPTPTPTPKGEDVEAVEDLLNKKRADLAELLRQYQNNLFKIYNAKEDDPMLFTWTAENATLTPKIEKLQKEIYDVENTISDFTNEITKPYYTKTSLPALEATLAKLQRYRDKYIREDDLEGVQKYNKLIKNLEDQIKNKKIELGLLDRDDIEEVKEVTYTIEDAFTSIMSLSSSMVSLGTTIGDVFDSDEIKEFFNEFNKGLQVINSVYSVFEAFNKVMEVSNALKAASNKLTSEGTATTIANAAANSADASALASGAVAGATNSGALLPFPYNLIAIGTGVAAVVGALALMGNYAQGGIVGGNTTVGDHGIARVNAGEMILNQREQTRLWHTLNGVGSNYPVGGNVSFRISGNDLVGVLDNYNNKNRRVR